MAKKQPNNAPQYTIDPQKVEQGGGYFITAPHKMSIAEVTALRLSWSHMLKRSGIEAWAFILPEGTVVEDMQTPQLKLMHARIEAALKERGEL